ncbi:MAG TPA: cysteine synthase A [Clostridia bacterium]|jgi:cysteine synthase A|nr:cysteine synthase A [Clostridia bacterium]
MKKVFSNILQAIGETPLVELQRLTGPEDARVLVKVEALNPGGSIKSRSAFAMIEAAEKAGLLKPDSIIVEPTSGNQGIGLAMVGAVKGYRVKIIMPDSVSKERRKLIQHYGAELILIPDKGDIGKTIDTCIKTALKMAEEDNRVFIPQQFENPNNVLMHKRTTAREILEQVDGKIDAFCCGIGTGGTITGIGEVLKEANPETLVVALEPTNAAILSGGTIGNHEQQGIGDGLIPPILNTEIIDEIITVTDEEAINTARRLAKEEGLMVGVSSGTNVYGALQLAKRLGKGKTVVTILPDTAERYYSTPLFQD